MSDLDNAINSINASAAKAENTAGFLDDMSTFDDQSSVTNPNNGQTVASIPKQVKDRTDELFAAAESDINQAVSDAEQSATDAQDAADSIGRYQGLWPDTGGSANKGDTYQTQVSGTSTGQYFTALQNTTVDPVGDDVNWREVVSDSMLASEIKCRTGVYRVGNISDYAGQSLPKADKLNSYQYPDDSGEWYGPIPSQAFPITIPVDPAASGEWALVNAIVELSTIARSLNVNDSEIIYSTDTATVLDDVLYIYDASTQVTWGVPLLDSTGETIVSVAGDALTTTGGAGGNSYTLITQEKSDLKMTLSEAVISTTIALNDSIRITDRAEGVFDVVLTSGVTPTGRSIIQSTAKPSLSFVLRKSTTVDVRSVGAVCDGSTDDTAALLEAISFAGVGGTLGFYGTIAVSSDSQTFKPLSSQKWIGLGNNATIYQTATTSTSLIEFLSSNDYASVSGIKIRSVTGFTGAAVDFNGSLNCEFSDSLMTNILNAKAVRFVGGAFYNKVSNVKATSVGTGVHVTGLSPATPNNNIIDNMDIYGVCGTGLFCDSDASMFQLNNFIIEAECTTAHLKVTNTARLIFNNPRFEGVSTPSDGYFDIIDGAEVTFNGPKFNIQKATHASFSSDLDEFRNKNLYNQIVDPLFIQDLDSGNNTPPKGWTVTAGATSAIVKSTTTPNVGIDGSTLKVTTSADTTILSYSLSGGSAQALFRGRKMRVQGVTSSVGVGTSVALVARQEGGAGGASSQTSENLDSPKFKIHNAELMVPLDATVITLQFVCTGNGGNFFLWTPVLEVEGSYYSLSNPTVEKPFFRNGVFIGDLGLSIEYASSSPTSGTYKRGDRVYNRFPSVGQPKSWVCTVAGTPGTWVSEGDL